MTTEERTTGVPRHIAIVMDGNGRWARARHRPRTFGHRAGQKAVRACIEFCRRRGVGTLTLFAFSSENWKRPASEVGALQQLFLGALANEVEELHRNDIRLRFIGDLGAFSPTLQASMQSAMRTTADNNALTVNIAVNYGGRWDIANAAREAARAVERRELASDAITEQTLAAYFCLADAPPVDLLVRTGGEMRISNFLLWQIAYAELWFTDTLWPDMDEAAFDAMLAAYARRERRFGLTGAQMRGPAGRTRR